MLAIHYKLYTLEIHNYTKSISTHEYSAANNDFSSIPCLDTVMIMYCIIHTTRYGYAQCRQLACVFICI